MKKENRDRLLFGLSIAHVCLFLIFLYVGIEHNIRISKLENEDFVMKVGLREKPQDSPCEYHEIFIKNNDGIYISKGFYPDISCGAD